MNISNQCINSAADIIGSKWTAQILREFASGNKRFCELERAIPDINPRTLTKRLEDLKNKGIIKPTSKSGYSGYELTTKGCDLLPILKKMADWGERYPKDALWNVA